MVMITTNRNETHHTSYQEFKKRTNDKRSFVMIIIQACWEFILIVLIAEDRGLSHSLGRRGYNQCNVTAFYQITVS